jgi:hypothetical protein
MKKMRKISKIQQEETICFKYYTHYWHTAGDSN